MENEKKAKAGMNLEKYQKVGNTLFVTYGETCLVKKYLSVTIGVNCRTSSAKLQNEKGKYAPVCQIMMLSTRSPHFAFKIGGRQAQFSTKLTRFDAD